MINIESVYSIVVWRLMQYASERLDDGGQAFDLCVIFFRDDLELCQGLFHSFFGYSAHDVSPFVVRLWAEWGGFDEVSTRQSRAAELRLDIMTSDG